MHGLNRQVRSSIFCAKISADVPRSTSNWLMQNAAQLFFSPALGESLDVV